MRQSCGPPCDSGGLPDGWGDGMATWRDGGRLGPVAALLAGYALLLTAGAALHPVPGWPAIAGLAGLLLLAGGIAAIFRRDASESRARAGRLALLGGAAGRLMRLRDADAIASVAEALAREALDCDSVRIVRDAAPLPAQAAGAASLVRPLRSASGDLLGAIAIARRDGPPFSATEAVLLSELAGSIAAALDSLARLEAATEARAAVERILATISDGMVVLDSGWCVRYANRAALRYLDRTEAALLGRTLWDAFPGLAGSEFAARLRDAAAQGEDADFTAAFPPRGAWFAARCYPFDGGLTVYLRDITAQHETEERLRQSHRLEALGQLTGGIAHDVNNLLTVVLGNFEMLALTAEERGAPGSEDFALAEAGLRAGASARRLMDRLLAFSRRRKLSPVPVDAAALFAALEPLLRRAVGSAVTLEIAAPDGLWPALADPAELEAALINLAVNARDAMPAGGRLLIEAANVTADRIYAAYAGLDRLGDYVMVMVADAGIGMTREVLQKAFDPFFTTKPAGKGTGLGLSMVYGFAKQSGGHVMIDSEPGHGTIVRLYLPRSADAAQHAALPAEDVQGGSETLLLVEDDDVVRAHTAAMLRGLGYRVHAAADGAEALRAVQDGVRPDLLLSDLVLRGGMSGRQLADAAGRQVAGLCVLFTSGYPGHVLRDAAAGGQDLALISKPFGRGELAVRVRAQLDAAPRPAVPPLAADAQTR